MMHTEVAHFTISFLSTKSDLASSPSKKGGGCVSSLFLLQQAINLKKCCAIYPTVNYFRILHIFFIREGGTSKRQEGKEHKTDCQATWMPVILAPIIKIEFDEITVMTWQLCAEHKARWQLAPHVCAKATHSHNINYNVLHEHGNKYMSRISDIGKHFFCLPLVTVYAKISLGLREEAMAVFFRGLLQHKPARCCQGRQ